MTLVTVDTVEQKPSARGTFTRACVVTPDGSRVWASVFKKELQPLMVAGQRLEVEFASSGDRGQFTDIVAAAPAGQDPQVPRVTHEGTVAAPAPAPDATADRIYRCTALNAAVVLATQLIQANPNGSAALLPSSVCDKSIEFAERYYAWLWGDPVAAVEEPEEEPF